jgi:protein tyrosine phosphatase (PTP) superfamily phosphohydrolase (DUF442 family)
MRIDTIYNFKRVDDRLVLGGQPSEEQLRAAAADGFAAVVNLSTNDPRYALPDEEGLVRALGMQYHYLPVQWDSPTADDFDRYVELMDNIAAGKILVHCAANYRVSAFHALYALAKKQLSADAADAFIASVWQPAEHPQWAKFIAAVKRRIAAMA